MPREAYPDLEENATVTYISRADYQHTDDLVELFPVYRERNWRKGVAFAGAALLAGVATKLLLDTKKES
jgi:hypothetical protein